MANKAVPQVIQGVTLHEKAQKRTNVLLANLEDAGAGPVRDVKSSIDRLRLVASAYFSLLERIEESERPVEEIRPDVAHVASTLG